MPRALVPSNILPEGIAQHISEYAEDAEEEEDYEEEWETIYGCVEVYRAKHSITYGGGPEGSYVLFEEALPMLEPGWCRWQRSWFEPTSYTPLEPHEDVVYRYDDHGSESLRVVDRYTYELWEDEVYMADALAP